MSDDLSVRHATVDVDGVETFHREAGRSDAPVVLLRTAIRARPTNFAT